MKTLQRLTGKMDAVDWITPQLAIGGRARTWRLRKAGITHVLNVREKPDKQIKGIQSFHNPTKDDGKLKGTDYWVRSMAWATEVLADPDTKLYCHCKAGVNRSSGTVYAILRTLGYQAEEAWAMVKTARPKVKPRYVRDVEDSI